MTSRAPDMRVTFIASGLDTGGAEHALHRLLPGLRALGVAADVVSLRSEGAVGPLLRAAGFEVTALGLPRVSRAVPALAALRAQVRRTQPQIVHGWMYHGNLAALAAARLAARPTRVAWGIRQSLTGHSADKWLTRRLIGASARLSGRADLIVYNSTAARADHERRGFAARRGVVVPNGFDAAQFSPDLDDARAMRRELGIEPGALVVGHVARFHPVKDHATLLRAAAIVRRSVPNAVFLLIGAGVDAQNPALASLVDELAPGPAVRLLGPRQDIARLTRVFDVACVSSRAESFPNVLAEAMCCEVPCVTTAVGDAPRVVGDTGIVVPVGDARALAEGVIAFAAMDRDARAARGRAARERVIGTWSLPEVARAYAHALTELLNG
jgi:glycosyltransferase involved in cell wall biosynthesis